MAYNLGVARGIIQLLYNSSSANRAERDLDEVERRARRTQRGMALLGAAAAAMGTVVVAGLAFALNASIDFEKQISAVGAVSGATGDELEKLREKALQLGADTSFSAGEAAMAMEELAKNGLSVADMLGGAADAAVALAAAGGVELAQAAEIASTAMTVFGLKAEDLAEVVDLLAQAANASAADVTDLGESLKYVGPIAKALGLKVDDVITALALLAKNGIKGSEAGTALRSVLTNLQPASKKAADVMKELGLITADGSNKFFDAQGNMKSLSEVSEILRKSLEKLTPQQRAVALEAIFGKEPLAAINTLVGESAEGFDTMRTSMAKSGTAADVAAERLDNTAGSIEALKGSIETLAIRIGDKLRPAFRTLIKLATTAVNKIADLLKGLFGEETDKVTGKMKDVEGAFGRVEKKADQLQEELDELEKSWDRATQAVERFIEAIVTLNKILEETTGEGFAARWLQAFTNLTEMITLLGTGISNVFAGVVGTFLNVFNNLYNIIRIFAALFTGNTEALSNAWDDFVEGIKKSYRDLGLILLGIAQIIAAPLQFLLRSIFDLFGADFDAWWAERVANLKKIWGGLGAFFAWLWKGINDLTAGIFTAMYNGIVEFGKAAGRFIADLWKKLTQSTKTDLGKAVAVVSGAMTSIRASVSAAFGSLRNIISGAMSSSRTAVSRGVSSMLSIIGGIAGQIRSAIGSNLGSVLYQAGRSVIQGLINGINSAIGSLKSKLSSVTALIPSWKGPQERDKVLLRDNGHLIMQSLVDAFEDYIPKIEATLGGITTSMPSMLGETPTINLPRQAPVVAGAPVYNINQNIDAPRMSPKEAATYMGRQLTFKINTGASSGTR